MASIDDLAERLERLLVRHAESRRTQALLESQLAAVVAERDSLKSRLHAARSRIDALLERLPADSPAADSLAAVGSETPATGRAPGGA